MDELPNISEWVANAIASTGCTVVYGGHGGALVPLVNAVVSHPKLTWVCARNEHNAATMAAAHAKFTGGLGVVIATSGPGATNLVTGLMEADLDSVSLLAITGMKPTAQLGYAEFQDVNQSRLFAGAGIWSKDAASVDGVIPLLRDAVAFALSRRTCAHLAIPVDIQAAISPKPLGRFCASHASLRLQPANLDLIALDKVADALVGETGKRKPRNIIAVGLRGCQDDSGKEDMNRAILSLAEALNAPVLTRLQAKGAVDESHPLSFGVIGVHGKPGLETAATLISSCDCVISIGVDDETLLICNVAGFKIRDVVEIEPDALALSTRFEAEHTLVGSVGQICRGLASRVEELKKKRKNEGPNQENVSKEYDDEELFDIIAFLNPRAEEKTLSSGRERLTSSFELENPHQFMKDADRLWKTFHEGNWKKITTLQNGIKFQCLDSLEGQYCHPAEVLDALSKLRRSPETDAVSKDAVIAVDVGDVTLWSSLCLNLTGNSRTLYSERLGTMGYALNAAIAAILSKPGPAGAVVLAGDGGFQMTLQELATFQQMKRPGDKLLCIVFDNQIMGRVAFGFTNAEGCELLGPDYVMLAKAYGGDGIRLDRTEHAFEVVKKALEADGLFMIHVIVDPETKADMATFSDNSLKVMNSG